jgi:threonine synthase
MYIKGFRCFKCGKTFPFPPDQEAQPKLCPCCAGMLLIDYDYNSIRQYLKKEDLLRRAPTIWRFSELLPIRDASNMVTRGEGGTPVLPLKRLGAELGLDYLYLKDESVLPFSTFRSRAAAVCVSRALENGVRTLAVHANLTEAYAWACYAAYAGLNLVLLSYRDSMLPQFRAGILATGARLYLHDGDMVEAEKLMARSAAAHGWYHVLSTHDPMAMEGWKTLAFEVAESFKWEIPATIVCPVDRDGMFRGLYRGLREMQALGWIPPALPRLVAVQSEDWHPVVTGWKEKKKEIVPPPPPAYEYARESGKREPTREEEALSFDSQSAAFVLDAIYKSLGCAVAVTEREMEAAKARLAEREGVIASRSSAATLAAVVRLRSEGWIEKTGHVLLLGPEHGLREFPSLLTPDGKRDPLLVDLGSACLPA